MTIDQVQQRLKEGPIPVQHLKTGNMYVILNTAINCTNAQDGQTMIVYKSMNKMEIFCREISEFFQKFKKL